MIRLILSILLFLLSLLAIFRAPTFHLWLVSIVVTEFPWIVLLVTLATLLVGRNTSRLSLPATILCLAAIVLFSTPIIRAYIISRTLKNDIRTALNTDITAGKQPFGIISMFTDLNAKQIIPQTFIYHTDSLQQLKLDYYRSAVKGRRPCIIVIHGGSWSGGDNKQLPELNTYLTKKGYNVAAIEYHLAPKHRNPTPINDVATALHWLRQQSASLNIDTNNLVLLGRSAGAQIALLAAYTLDYPGLKGVISFYGPADMVWGYSLPANPLVMDSRKVMEDYLGGTYKQIPQSYYASSPIETVTSHTLPTLLIHGKNDPLVAYEHSTRLSKKLKQLGVRHFLLTLPWATHGCDYTLAGPSGQLSTYAVEAFLKAVTY
jgi:acetyl esterase/lipase